MDDRTAHSLNSSQLRISSVKELRLTWITLYLSLFDTPHGSDSLSECKSTQFPIVNDYLDHSIPCHVFTCAFEKGAAFFVSSRSIFLDTTVKGDNPILEIFALYFQ